jgi:hypothetical protein
MAANLHITLEDDHGRTTKRTIGMETEATLAAYTANITAFALALDAITDLALIKAVLAIDVTGDEFVVVADANVDIGGKFSGWLDSVPARRASLGLPGIKSSLVDADGSIQDAGVTATYLDLFESAAKFSIAHGFQISTWVKGTLDR